MKSCFKCLILTLACVFAYSANASEKDWFFKPYVGLDFGGQHLPFEDNYGEFHFKEGYPAGNFNLGVWLHKYAGIEIGYEHMFQRERHQHYPQTVPVLGFQGHVLSGVGDQLYISKTHADGFNLSLLFRYPVAEKTELFAVFGAMWSRLHVSMTMIQDNNAASRPLFWRSDRETVARIGFGVKQMFASNLGGRLFYLFENTSQLEAGFGPERDFVNNVAVPGYSSSNPAFQLIAKPKNSNLLMAGLFYQADWV